MKGEVLARAEWRRLCGQGTDRCRLLREPGGYMLAGHARLLSDGVHSALDYMVRCDPGWTFTSADIVGRHAGQEVGWKVQRQGEEWHVTGGAPLLTGPDADFELGFSPATLLIGLRRLGAGGSDEAPVAMLCLPDGHLEARARRLSLEGPVTLGRDGAAARELATHPSGFPTLVPDLWEGEVSDAP